MTSIRHQLLFGLLAVVVIAGLAAAWGVYQKAHRELDELFDYQLKQMALSLRDQSFRQVAPGPSEPGDEFDFVVQVWDREGVRLYFSHPRSALPNRAFLGYETVTTDDGDWRVFSVQHHGVTVQVAQPMSIRNRLAAAAAWRTLAPFLFLLPGLGLLVWLTVGHGFRPLAAFAHAVQRRTPSALDPLPGAKLPQEIRPLAEALNDLLGRLKHALAVQRDFVADAAHELRTPLTALRLQVQLAERASDAQERAAAFAHLRQGLDRATHLVEQLLTLARQEPDAGQRPLASIDLGALAREVVAERAPLAEARGLDLGVARCDAVSLLADREGLRAMLANLVDNAVRYTPAGGKIDVSAYHETGQPVLEVVDNGPGIPKEERERVFNRFYRRAGAEGEGSGLGLAIVKNVAERHRARVILADGAEGRGLAVRVVFPST